MPSLGGAEILVILVVALIVFGPHRLPEIGRQIGGALREVRRVQNNVKREINDAIAVSPTPQRPPMDRADSDRDEPEPPPPPRNHPAGHQLGEAGDPPAQGSFS